MSLNDAIVFFRKRLALAAKHTGELRQASEALHTHDREVQSVWTDITGVDVRRRELGPHRQLASRQLAALSQAINESQALLGALEETARRDHEATQAIAASGAAIQLARVSEEDARRSVDAGISAIDTAESALAAARSLLAAL